MRDPNEDTPPDGPSGADTAWWRGPRPSWWPVVANWPPPPPPNGDYGTAPTSYDEWQRRTETPTPPPPGAGGGAGGGSGSSGGSGTNIYNSPLTAMFGEKFQAPPMLDLGGPAGLSYLPNAPTLDFKAPTVEDALKDPGYQFVVGQGENALNNWAASKGTLNDSETGKSFIRFGQGAAGQQYDSVFNRQLNTAEANFQPRFSAWQTTAQAGQHQNDANFSNAWNAFLNRQSEYYNWQDRTFGKQFQVATA
jgi:hypothetical protein